MSVRIITDGDNSVIYDSVTMTAFGPVFNRDEDPNDFLEWLAQDARSYNGQELWALWEIGESSAITKHTIDK